MRTTLAILVLAGVMTGLSAADILETDKGPRKVILTCQWKPQAQFIGYYLAASKGIYHRYGLDVKILHVGSHFSSGEYLTSNKAQFATMFLATGIKLRAKGVKVVNIAQMFRKSSLLFVAKRRSGIHSIEDLSGRRIGIWESDFQEIPLEFLKKHGINAKVVMFDSGVNLFLYGGVDAQVVTSYNELHQLLMAGLRMKDLSIFDLNAYGLNIPEDGIYCQEEFYKANTQLCVNFAKASIEGWKYAFEHPDEALETLFLVLKQNNVRSSRKHQTWMLRQVRELIFPNWPAMVYSGLSQKLYLKTATILKDAGEIKTIPPFKTFYKGTTP